MSLETYTIPSVIDEWNIILIDERINRGKILKEIATFIQRSLIWSKTKLLKKVWHVKGNDGYVWFGILADEIVNEDDIFETLYRNNFLFYAAPQLNLVLYDLLLTVPEVQWNRFEPPDFCCSPCAAIKGWI